MLGWHTGRVGDLVASIDAGVSVNGDARRKQKGEIGVLKVSAVSSTVFDPGAYKVVINKDLNRVKEPPLKGHIIVSRSNSPELVGASALVTKNYTDLFLSDKLWQLKLNKKRKISTKWFALLLASAPVRYRLSQLATGTSSSMKNISKNDLLTLPIVIPPIEEQREIARIITAWDNAITVIAQQITTKQEKRKVLMQQLLTGKQRFPVFTKPWRSVPLGEIFSNRTETGREDLPLLSITGDGGVVNRNTIDRRDTSSSDKSRYLKICPGDIGYNTMRMWQGVSGLSTLEGIISPAYTVVTPDNSLDAEFMAVFFKFEPTINLFRRYSQGLVDDTLNLKYRHFEKIKVTIPEKEEQTKIASIFRMINHELELLEQQLYAYKKQKKGLMQQLLTGKLRVNATQTA